MAVSLHLGDCVTWAREYSGEPFHALLCDPPYHLTSIVKRFGADNSAPAQFGKDGAFSRASAGFMNQKWDGGDLAFDPATWDAFARILYPGAFGMAFASSRGWHRMAVAIEDAGLIIHPSIFGWAYGSGFPKATRVDTQIDREAGAEREVIGTSNRHTSKAGSRDFADGMSGFKSTEEGGNILTAPATPLAATFAGHRYGLQALKPALEPIIVFQKPYAGRPVDNITATGAGALNVDGGRIPASRANERQYDKEAASGVTGSGSQNISFTSYHNRNDDWLNNGRWPSNFYLGDAEAARRLDEQSGTLTSGQLLTHHKRGGKSQIGTFNIRDRTGEECNFGGDSGGASRFFFRVAEQLDDADPVRYCAKASRRERDEGLEGMVESINVRFSSGKAGRCPEHDTTNPSGMNTYSCGCPIQYSGQKEMISTRNPHPTVKPLSLTRYLATLLLPPAEYAPRRLFVPFAGVASECIGAMQAGWEDVQGVELTDEYLPIARARVEHWQSKPQQMELSGG